MGKNWPGGLISNTPVIPAGPARTGAASGVWTLTEALQWGQQGKWPKVSAIQFLTSTFLVNQTGDGARSLTLSSGFGAGDMLVAMTGNRTFTPPTLLSGYTDVVSVAGVGLARSLRIQYKIATSSSETINWTGAYGYLLVLRGATQIGKSGVVATSNGTTQALPDLTGLDTTGRGYIIAGSYATDTYTAVSAPYAFLLSGTAELAAYVSNNTNSSLTGATITASLGFASTYAVEFLP